MVVNTPERMPPMSAALALELLGLEVQREQFGMHNCLNRIVGPRRKKLGAVPKYGPVDFSTPAEDLKADAGMVIEIVRDQARVVLAEFCRDCPFQQCKMKAW